MYFHSDFHRNRYSLILYSKTCIFSQEATASYVYLQIAADNLNKQTLNIVEILSDRASGSNYETIKNIGNNIPGIKTEQSYIIRENILEASDKLNQADLILISNLSSDENVSRSQILKYYYLN